MRCLKSVGIIFFSSGRELCPIFETIQATISQHVLLQKKIQKHSFGPGVYVPKQQERFSCFHVTPF